MKPSFAVLFLPSVLLALGAHPISTPKDFLDRNLPLLDGATLSDGTWVVSDSELSLWSSPDNGSTWESIPTDSLDGFGEIVGGSVVSSDRLSTWSLADGWTPMRFPTSFESADDNHFGSGGARGFRDENAGRIRYFRSTDGLMTWTEWFSMDTSRVPNGSDTYGEMQLGRIWYIVSDSGYIRGTANGTTWTKSVLPEEFEPIQFDPDENDTCLQILGYFSTEIVLMRSGRLGTDWRKFPLSEPGARVRRMAAEVWSSTTASDLESKVDWWFARSPNGPWSKLDVEGINACFASTGSILLATNDGLQQLDLTQTNSTSGRTASIRMIRRAGSRLEIQLPLGQSRTRWSLYSLDGSVLGTGYIKPGRSDISCPQGAAWIRIGRTTLRVPPY